jgi:hypothetical protein
LKRVPLPIHGIYHWTCFLSVPFDIAKMYITVLTDNYFQYCWLFTGL